MPKFPRRPIRPTNDTHFVWQEGDVTWNIPLEPIKEITVPKHISTPKAIALVNAASQEEKDMYQRYVAYFDSRHSPYAGPAPLPFFMWLVLPLQQRPGGPEVSND